MSQNTIEMKIITLFQLSHLHYDRISRCVLGQDRTNVFLLLECTVHTNTRTHSVIPSYFYMHKLHGHMVYHIKSLADPGGATGMRPPPPPIGSNSFVFTYVFAKKCPHRRLVLPNSSAPPPTGNSGSATVNISNDSYQVNTIQYD